MIYDYLTPDQPIRQGDIFVRLPRVELSLKALQVLETDEANDAQVSWQQLLDRGEEVVTAMVAMRATTAIVITQDCDALRTRDVALCEIRPIGDVTGQKSLPTSAKSWVSFLRGNNQKNLKWFYLPPDPALGLTEKMAVDFQVVLSLPRADLLDLIALRKGRLNTEADEHFRERLSEFFRRYPVDEWYPYNQAEFADYKSQYADAEPRPWQR